MYQWLSEAVENNSIVITASRRLARVLNSEYGKEQLALGNKAWLSPNIRFLDDWLTSTVNAVADSLPIVLAGHASGIIWERCLKEQAGASLLNIGGLVRQARQSWQRLHDWRVPLSEVSTEARSQDEQLFAAAARKYQAILADNSWIDDAQIAGIVAGLIESRAVPAPESVVYAGFDRLAPAVEHLFAIMADIGCVVSVAQVDEAAADVLVAAFDNADAELRAAGAWARRQLTENPSATVGIVSSSLDRNALATERLIREGLAPGWQYGGADLRTAVNTSYGRRLSDYPVISIALLLLQWVHRGLSFSEISLLLRTQFMSAQETSGRCKLEMYLRRLPDQPWTPSALHRLFKRRAADADAAAWLEGVERLRSFQAGADDKANPAAWADKIDKLLDDLGWPGSKTLASDEFQLLNRWRELLNDLARLEIVCPKVTFAEASSRLTALASDTIYQPQTQPGVIRLLGPLEAAGMSFDSLWVSGLDADNWPPATHPLTLVSRQLQRQHSMPDSTPDDTLEYSRRVLDRLVKSADRVSLSWPQSSEEFENSASPLIARYQAVIEDWVEDPGWHAVELVGSHDTEIPADDPVPAVQQDEFVAGGAYTVQRQVTEPFSAFAHGRLRVSELNTVATGLSPQQRGNLIHKVLHALFAERPSQDAIRQWTGSDLQERILKAVDASLKEYLWHADPVLRRVLALERDRLLTLVETFVDEELTRSTFTIDSVEQEIEFEQFGVRLALRIDRIDRLSDESLIVADYKTGQPKNFLNRSGDPLDLQLVVYACALEENIGGLVLINIDSRSIKYSGAAASGEWDAKRADQWAMRLTAWQERVAMAMQQIAKGDARINLNLPSDKTRPLNILSRFEERLRAER
ncbi:MAG: PD-(D/E)XK nuclease family protein [Woeseiaceae bacterium]